MKLYKRRRIQKIFGRPPCGGRGLKLNITINFALFYKSPPVRGAWIETKFESFSRS